MRGIELDGVLSLEHFVVSLIKLPIKKCDHT